MHRSRIVKKLLNEGGTRMNVLKMFTGRRVLKTMIAVFLTALVCQALNIPAVFAVMTAIVTIEPTAEDSIKKGLVRFPASAIGSFYAATFFYFFQISPFSYALAASFTIVTCYKLKLFDGLLVATLTSVAMVYVIDGSPIDEFFIRLLTTTIGLTVSTLVNLFLFPANYMNQIEATFNKALLKASKDLEIFAYSLKHAQLDQVTVKSEATFHSFHLHVEKIEQLLTYQQKEAHYHTKAFKRETDTTNYTKKLHMLKLIHYHIGNLTTPLHTEITWDVSIIEEIDAVIIDLCRVIEQQDQPFIHVLDSLSKRLIALFNQGTHCHSEALHLKEETVILYELIQLIELVKQYK